MNKFVHILVTSLIVFGAQTSSAVILTFDDIPGFTDDEGLGQNLAGPMPTYKGFEFSEPLQWIDAVVTEVNNSPYNYGAHSGEFTLHNNIGFVEGSITEASGADFTFDGLWAKRLGAPPESGGEDNLFGTMSGFRDGSPVWVWQVDTSLNGSYEYYGAQAGLIDELRLDLGNYFLVDDLELNAVPVPAAAWLFSSGLIGLIGVARRKSQA